jgi:type III pantothenate kinase
MLAIDVGNTHITNALVDGEVIKKIARVPTAQCIADGALFGSLTLLEDGIPPEIVVSSVRKDVMEIIVNECADRVQARPFLVDVHVEMGITDLYRTTETLGTDRLVNASAAYHIYSKGACPLIVVDMGTATTIDYVTQAGEFLGGAIAPGLISAYQGLISLAPELPRVEISPVEAVIGQTTNDCMRSGVIVSHAAMVSEMAAMMGREKGTSPRLIITGGLSAVVKNSLPQDCIVDEHLTLKGLSIIYNINKV